MNDSIIHYIPNWKDQARVGLNTSGFDTLCGLYVYDDPRSPRHTTPYISGTNCKRCIRKLREKGLLPAK